MPKFEPVIVNWPLWPLTGEMDEITGEEDAEYVKLRPVVSYETEFVLI